MAFSQKVKRLKIIVAGLVCSVFGFCAYATSIQEDIEYKEQVVQKLKEEISQIDSEMARCEKARKNWKTATIIGSIGVAATGTAAVIQVVNANKSEADKDKK